MFPLKLRVNLGAVRTVLFYIVVIGLPFCVFAWQLSAQTNGFGPIEATSRSAAKLSAIRTDSLFLPYKLLENILFHLTHGARYGLRLTSVIFGLVFIFAFFNLLKSWFGKPIALLASLLMALTPLYLLASRTANSEIVYCSSILVLYAFSRLRRHPGDIKYALLFVICLVVCLYTPGLVWLILLSGALWLRQIRHLFTGIATKTGLLLGLFGLFMMVPLLINFVQEPNIFKQWLLLPNSWPAPLALLKSIAWMIIGLFIRLRDYNNLNLGRLPILNAIQIGLLIFGFYIMLVRLTRQLYWLIGSILIAIILAALNNNSALLLIALPSISFMCGMGLRYLFIEWRSIFPRNPLAKTFAIGLMSAIVLIHIVYGVRYSLIAWPNSQRVKDTYVIK